MGEGKKKRGKGRRLRYLEDAEKGLREMKFKIWRQKVVDREECVSVIKKVLRVLRANK